MSLAEELLADLEDSEDEDQVEEAETGGDVNLDVAAASGIGTGDFEMELATEPTVAATAAAGQSLKQVAKLFTRYVYYGYRHPVHSDLNDLLLPTYSATSNL